MIIVVGAGISGLSVAWELSRRGEAVTVLEASQVASGASGVATSYLEPRLGTGPTRALEWQSLGLWSEWAAEIERVSGENVGFSASGQIRLASADTLDWFDEDFRQRSHEGWQVRLLSSSEMATLEPGLGDHAVKAAFVPEVSVVDGQRLCHALTTAISRSGGEVRTKARVVQFAQSDDQHVLSIEGGEELVADKVIFATGLDGEQIGGLPSEFPASRPVRGVNLILDMSSLEQPIRHHIKHRFGNFCPREQNRLIVGTTYEQGQTSFDIAPEVVERIYRNAETVFPAPRELPLLDVTVGLRSKTASGSVYCGRVGKSGNVFATLGHAGSGFLRAPALSKQLAELIEQSA